MNSAWLIRLIPVLPRIRGPIQLAGLLFAIFSAVLIHQVDPGDLGSLSLSGAIGLGLVVIPLAFHRNVLEYIPKNHRVFFLLTLFSIILISFAVLVGISIRAVIDLKPEGLRFDTKVDTKEIKVFHRENGTAKLEIPLNFYPLSSDSNGSSSVFIGMITIHDEDMRQQGLSPSTTLTCEQVASCVGSLVLRDFSGSQKLHIRANTSGPTIIFPVEVKRLPKNSRIGWTFYQSEGPRNGFCGIDPSKIGPEKGIPHLAMYRNERRIGNSCYFSFGQRIFSTS